MPDNGLQGLLDALRRANAAWPQIQEQAVQSGDFTEADKAGRVMDRLSTLVQTKLPQVKQAQDTPERPLESRSPKPETGISGMNTPPSGAEQPYFPALTQDAQADAKAQKVEDLGGLSPIESAARGAVKGAADAVKSSIQAVAPADALLPTQQGELPPAVAERVARGSAGFPEITPEEVKANRERLYATGYGQAPLPEITPEQIAANRAALYAKGFGQEAAPSLTNDYLQGMSSRAGNVDAIAQIDALLAKPRNQIQTEEAEPAQVPFPKEEIPAVTAEAEKVFQGDPVAALHSMQPYVKGAPTFEQEYNERLKTELGARPKKFTVTRLLAAALYGMGSIFSRWATGNWRGQGYFPDFDKEQEAYDQRAHQIGQQVYAAREARGRAEVAAGGRQEAAKTREGGLNERLATAEKGRGERLKTAEEGKNTRQQGADAVRERIANIRAQSKGATADRMSLSDKAQMDLLKTEYNGIDHTLMTVDPKVKARGDKILADIEAIIQKYANAGK